MLDINDYPKRILDCRKEAEYPDHEEDFQHWAWEFLRRNQEYQYLWDLFKTCPDWSNDGYKNGKWKSTFSGGRFFQDHYHYAEPPPVRGETGLDYEKRTNGKGEIYAFSEYFEQKFKIWQRPIDYRTNPMHEVVEIIDGERIYKSTAPSFTPDNTDDALPPWAISVDQFRKGQMNKYSSEYANRHLQNLYDDLGENLYVFAFDASRKSGPQLAEVKAILDAKLMDAGVPAKKRPSMKARLGERYLRILDGLAEGLPESEVSKIISESDPSIKDDFDGAMETAIQIRDETYWQIAR